MTAQAKCCDLAAVHRDKLLGGEMWTTPLDENTRRADRGERTISADRSIIFCNSSRLAMKRCRSPTFHIPPRSNGDRASASRAICGQGPLGTMPPA
jgi:hypothetical protein